MDQARTVLICVGATKAGTSWLRAYLGAHPQVSMRRPKELHYFDHFERRASWGVQSLRAEMQALRKRLAALPAGDPKRAQLQRGIDDRRALRDMLALGHVDLGAYLAYLEGGAGAARVVGDVTPAYALLSEATLEMIAGMAPDVRVLFLMRDPVARLWSHVRMAAMRRGGDETAVASTAYALLERIVSDPGAAPHITDRGDYPAILRKLRKTIPAARLKLAFTEEAITPEGVVDLCAFLGLDAHPADTAKRVHEGVAVPLDAARRARARDYLASQYDYVEQDLGHLPSAWRAKQAGN